MKRTISISLAVLAAVCLFRASQLMNTAHAQNEGGPVVHRVNPESLPDNGPETNRGNRPGIGDALTTGGTGVVTPAITYHGGALIQTPSIYIIWYGNWNQTNGSDTPAGQQIVRDFAGSIGGSPYFLLNTTTAPAATTSPASPPSAARRRTPARRARGCLTPPSSTSSRTPSTPASCLTIRPASISCSRRRTSRSAPASARATAAGTPPATTPTARAYATPSSATPTGVFRPAPRRPPAPTATPALTARSPSSLTNSKRRRPTPTRLRAGPT